MKADAPPIQNLINRIFRCRHRRRTIPFTPRGESQCYAVCLDCGQRILGASPLIAPPTPVPSPPGVTAPQPTRAPSSPAKSRRRDKKRIRRPLAPKEDKAAASNSPRGVFSRRAGRFNLLWTALFAAGLSGGLYFAGRPHAQPLAPPPRRSLPKPPEALSPAPASSPEIEPPAPKQPERRAIANSEPHLEGKSSLLILGIDEPAIQELSHHPGRLPELVQRGWLFTAPRGAAVQVEEEQGGVLKVVLLSGAMAGREGWVQASQVAPR